MLIKASIKYLVSRRSQEGKITQIWRCRTRSTIMVECILIHNPWMDEWIDEMNGWMNERINQLMNEMNGWMNEMNETEQYRKKRMKEKGNEQERKKTEKDSERKKDSAPLTNSEIIQLWHDGQSPSQRDQCGRHLAHGGQWLHTDNLVEWRRTMKYVLTTRETVPHYGSMSPTNNKYHHFNGFSIRLW